MPTGLKSCARLPAQPAIPTSPAHHHCTVLVIGFMTHAAIIALADMQREHNLIITNIPACTLSSALHPLTCKDSCCMFSCNYSLPDLCLQSDAEQTSSFDHISSCECLNSADLNSCTLWVGVQHMSKLHPLRAAGTDNLPIQQQHTGREPRNAVRGHRVHI